MSAAKSIHTIRLISGILLILLAGNASAQDKKAQEEAAIRAAKIRAMAEKAAAEAAAGKQGQPVQVFGGGFAEKLLKGAADLAQPEKVIRERQAQERAMAVKVLAAPAMVQGISEEQFNSWVFRQDRTLDAARQRIDSTLTLQIEDIDRTCKLTTEQKQKLLLVGRGDIKKFFNQYDAVKEKYQSLKHDAQNVQEVYQLTTPLQTALQTGIFQGDSLLHKAVQSTLTNDQRRQYDALLQERRQFRHQASVRLAVNQVEQVTPLRATQRQKLIEILTKETRSPRVSGPYDQYFIWWQLAKVPEEKFKVVLDEPQLKVLNRLIEQYRAIEPTLRQAGYLTDDDENDKAEAKAAAPRK